MSAGLGRARDELATRNAELASTLESLQASRRQVELLQQLKGELSKFVPDAVKALLERNPNATELEKRTEEVSVLFLDIAGYTKLSEQVPPDQLNHLVQTYFSSFLEIIRAHHGDVNETAGDGLMVIFQGAGAGDKREAGRQDHALNATRAAFAIRQKTIDLNEQHRGTLPAIALHMGINTGEALVGATKLGGAGAQRWTFTATGPVTNQAARFAGFAQGGEVIVGPLTAERIRVVRGAGGARAQELQERVRADPRLPPHPAGRVREDRVASLLSGGGAAAAGRLPGPRLRAMALLGLLDRVRLGEADVALGHRDQPLVVLVQQPDLRLGQVLDVDQSVARAVERRHDLVELQVDGAGVLVLRALDEEDHQEGDDGRPRVDHELPGVREAEDGARDPPDEDDREGDAKRPRAARPLRGPVGQAL